MSLRFRLTLPVTGAQSGMFAVNSRLQCQLAELERLHLPDKTAVDHRSHEPRTFLRDPIDAVPPNCMVHVDKTGVAIAE